MPIVEAPVEPGWQARLKLGFTRSNSKERTLLSHCHHSGPLQVQRPFYPETNGTCHVYILHPPGGVVGGDMLTVEVALESGAEALLTTPAAGKFYRSSGATARQIQNLQVSDNTTLEWLPQENIIFQGAKVHLLTRVELSKNASFIGWEILCLGRPAAGERFDQGICRQHFEIWRNGVPLYLEHSRYHGGSELLLSRWGLAGLPITASLLCITHQLNLTEKVRQGVGKIASEELFGVSQLDEVLICRYLGPSVERARYLLSRIWMVLRPVVAGKTGVVPRVWNT